ncbi:MAG: D-alanine--D-alanine ligase [Coriobacteriales bacterium]|jgi:D-alanine-D-alanine ligase|nr:D-alanine--D-alanine ligase [Coriobacteriales bacterium]
MEANFPQLSELQETAASVTGRATSVALLYGGTSSEREVSIASGNEVRRVLEQEGFSVFFIDTKATDFIDELRAARPDVAFIALHGKGGEDGCIQGFLETLGIPYTHSGVEASALAMDKQVSKILYRIRGLVTAEFSVVRKDQFSPQAHAGCGNIGNKRAGRQFSPQAHTDLLLEAIGLPCVVKPVCDGSSFGVSIPKTRDEFLHALDNGFEGDDTLMVEQFIRGTEVTVPVLGNDYEELLALPVIEIVPKNEFYDYESKYEEGGSEHIIPARITETEAAACQQAAIDAHDVLGCAGVSRTDMIVAEDGTLWLIETNTIPGMTRTSLIPEDAKKVGLTPGELYRLLIHFALERANYDKAKKC